MASFGLTREKKGDREKVTLSGRITAEAGLEFIKLYELATKTCTFNFRAVEQINSQGLQAWMLFLRTFTNDHEVVLEECPPVIVNQMNMLPSFTLNAKVASVFVPFFCSQCSKVHSIFLESRHFPKPNDEIKAPLCPVCQGPTELDDFDYFLFVGY